MKKKFLSISLFILGLFLICTTQVNAEEEDLVKVYIFGAGGCPYCEYEMEYLEGLDSYGEKFTIVYKEMYVDHEDWEEGEDYDLGVLVADAFYDAGFTDATYLSTPFVVISDIYAAATYSEDLETYIDQAYEEGDKDVVGCYEEGNSDCLDGVTVSNTLTSEETEEDNNTAVIAIVFIGLVVIVIGGLVILSNQKTNKKSA